MPPFACRDAVAGNFAHRLGVLDRVIGARGWYHSGFLTMMAGEPDRAIEQAEVSLRLSPRSWSGPVHTMIGASHFLSRRFDEAIAKLLLALGVTPNAPVAFRYLAACYACL